MVDNKLRSIIYSVIFFVVSLGFSSAWLIAMESHEKDGGVAAERLHVRSPKLSPNKQLLLFDYTFSGGRFGMRSSTRIGVYYLTTGKIIPLRLANGFSWSNPTISRDGRYAAFEQYCFRQEGCPGGERGSWVVLMDLYRNEVSVRKLDDRPEARQEAPAFSPDGRWVAYAETLPDIDPMGRPDTRLDTYTVKRRPVGGGPAETLLSPADHPYPELSISRLYFIDDDELLIGGLVSPEHRDLFPALYGGGDMFYLHLTVGEGVVPISESPRFAWVRDFPDLRQLSFASGGPGLFVAQARDPGGAVQRVRSDLYVVENGTVRALGVHELDFGLGDISPDGELVATSNNGDIVLVRTATGEKTRTGIGFHILNQAIKELNR